MEYHPYTSYHVSESLQLLLFTGSSSFVLVKLKKISRTPAGISIDWFYRMGGRAFLWLARQPSSRRHRVARSTGGRPVR